MSVMHIGLPLVGRTASYPISDILAKIASLWPVYQTPFSTFGHSVNGGWGPRCLIVNNSRKASALLVIK